jgi:hypothetical protein
MINNDCLQERFATATEAIRSLLQKTITNEEAREIIARYTAAFEGNFVAWMAATTISTQTVQGRYAAEENIEVEMRDNHPGMLRKFAQFSNAEPSQKHYESIQKELNEIRKLVAELNGVKNIALMTYLENTSAAFIPYLAQLGKQLGCTDFTYTNVHGIADISHADQFLWALEHEMKKEPKGNIDQVIQKGYALLKAIFLGEVQ